MDMVLIASVNPYIARILGLYWVDETVIDEVYDYKIECIWLNKLWNLENIVDFDKDTVEKQFFNIFKKDSFVFINTGIV